MTMDASQFYKDEDVCIGVLADARRLWGSTSTTEAQYDKMEEVLGFAWIYGPESLHVAIESALHEATRRKFHFILNVWSKHEEN